MAESKKYLGEYKGIGEGHNHKVNAHLALEPYKCNGCRMPGSKECYKCIEPACHFCLHIECFEPSKGVGHNLLESCKEFEFHAEPPEVSQNGEARYCDACGLDILGFRYECSASKSDPLHSPHDLHPTCAKLELKQDWKGWTYYLEDKVDSKCWHCEQRYPAEECIQFTGWKWVAKTKDWRYPNCFWGAQSYFHVKCMNEMQAPGFQ